MKQNLGTLDRIFRFVLGVWWLSPLAPAYSVSWVNWAVFVVGWIVLAESFLGWCWVQKLLQIGNKN